MKRIISFFSLLILSIFIESHAGPCAYGQAPNQANAGPKTAETRAIFLEWLDGLESALKQEYYDPTYHGIDLNARLASAKGVVTLLNYDWQMFQVLDQILKQFDDSHTFLILPPRKDHFDYGFNMQIIGDNCLVTSVSKESDAEKAGLEVGDKILRIGSAEPNRHNLWRLSYILYSLSPLEMIELTVRKEDSSEKTLKIKAKTTPHKEYLEARKKLKDKEKNEPLKCAEITKEITACKLYTFEAEKSDIDRMMKSVAGHSKLILDLRGNSGGSVSTEEYLTGYFFDHDFKMLDFVGRKKTEERVAKSKGNKAFKGELVVLVDSESASASEIFARVVQLENRGKVIGDVSSGSVMTSVPIALLRYKDAGRFGYKTKVFPLWMSLSIGDVVMKDGGRLEKKGVVPDVQIILTGAALKNGLDPVLAEASNMLGWKLSPEAAGKMFFIKYTKNEEYRGDSQIEEP